MTLLITQLLFWTQSRLNRDERGATAVEYALILGVIALGIIAVAATFGDNLADVFTDANTELQDNRDTP